MHAVVARSTFRSQNVQNTSVSDDFWKLRCRKSARRCGGKHISKSKCTEPLSSKEQKGKDCFLDSFLAPEIDMIFGNGVEASLEPFDTAVESDASSCRNY